MNSLISRPQSRSYEPGRRRADDKARQNDSRYRFERVSRERGNHQNQDDADSEGNRIGHHENQQGNLKARRHGRSLSIISQDMSVNKTRQ